MMVGVFVGLIAVLSEFGIAAGVIYLPKLTRLQLRQVNSLSLATAAVAACFSLLFGPVLASFYRQHEVALLMPAMAGGLILSGFRAVPSALLQKELRFRLVATIEVAQSFVQASVTILLAWFGLGYWALAAGILLGDATGTAATLFFQHPGFAVPRRSDIGPVLKFSGAVLVSNISWYAFSNSDFTIAGRLLGKAALGAYSMAWSIAVVPAEKIAALVKRVTPGYLARLKDEPEALGHYVRRVSQGISVLVFPAALGMALVAKDFVSVVLGSKWVDATRPLICLCLYVAISSPSSLLPQVLNPVGKPMLATWTSLLRLAVMPVAFYIGSRWGPTGIAMAWLLAFPLVTIPLYLWTFRAAQLRPREYFRAFIPPLLSSAAMASAVLFTAFALTRTAPPVRLSLEIAVGVVIYGTALAWLEPSYIHLLRERFRIILHATASEIRRDRLHA
jgi:PST family polysaccharide transporter